MYDINLKNTKKGYLIGIILFLAGIFFLIIMSWMTFGDIIKKLSLDSSIVATRIDDNCRTNSEGDYFCSPIYYYEVDGFEYTCKVSYSSSSSVSSKQNKVYYDSKNPSDCVTDYTAKPQVYMYLFCLFPLIFVIVGMHQILKVNKKIKRAKYLAMHGTLIQRLPYTMEKTNITVDGSPLLAIAVDYTLPSGSKIHLVGDPRYDRKQFDNDGLVDLLIDLNDLDNYYIDFNITRK